MTVATSATPSASTSTSRHAVYAAPLPRASDKRVVNSSATMTREDWRRELEKLLNEHEPTRAHCADEILTAYAGLERELVQCYRHYYTGAGGFRVAAETETFSLPREAIDTFLRLKLRARRSRSFESKGDGMRDVELASSPVATPRPRAASTSSVVRMQL